MVDLDRIHFTTEQKEKINEIIPIVEEAYLFGYPLMVMERTRKVMSNVPKIEGSRGPMNQVVHCRSLPDGDSKEMHPNIDVLNSTSWLEVSHSPMVLSTPNIKGRFFSIAIFDAWARVFYSIGTRTTGEWKSNFALVGPGFKGKIPKGVKKVVSPSNIVYLVVQIQCRSKDDQKAVNDLQDKIKMTPLDDYGHKFREEVDVFIEKHDHHHVDRSIDMETPPAEQVEMMEVVSYFQILSELIKENPHNSLDKTLVDHLEVIGVNPRRSFDVNSIDNIKHKALELGVSKAKKMLADQAKNGMDEAWSGWTLPQRNNGEGADHLKRASAAKTQLGIGLMEEMVQVRTNHDEVGRKLDGKNKYFLHFIKEGLPPVSAFWSLTMYSSEGALVKNRINKFAIKSQDKLLFNEDGSLDIYIQSFSPGDDKEPNWLPAPLEDFDLMLNLYWPKPEVLQKKWTPPSPSRVS